MKKGEIIGSLKRKMCNFKYVNKKKPIIMPYYHTNYKFC